MYLVYIIYSKIKDRYYTGQTDNLEQRLLSHNYGRSKYTRIADDWIVVYTETFQNRQEAIQRENEIKKKKSRKYIQYLIENWSFGPESFRDASLAVKR